MMDENFNGSASADDEVVLDATQATYDLFQRLRDRKNPYLKPAADAARDDLRSRLPIAFAHRANDAVGGLAPNHNVLTLACGLAYANAGLHVVDAHALDGRGKGTGPGGQSKVARGARWQERATLDPEEIVTFWTGEGEYPADKNGEAYPYAAIDAPRNVSIAFPEGCGLFVLDIDGDAGRAALEAMEAEHGTLPQTWKSITGSGGLHLIFRAEGLDIRNTASSIAPGVDVRGKNGQIIAPPSIHPSGKFYRWADGCAPWECEVADAPGWLIKLALEATKANKPSGTASKGKTKKVAGRRTGARGETDARGFEEHLSNIGDHESGRGFDGPIYSAACAYFAREGADADVKVLKTALLEAITSAECEDERVESRYGTDAYLDGRIEQARLFIEDREAEEATDDEDEDAATGPYAWVRSPFKVKDGVIFKKTEDGPPRALCGGFEVVGRSSNLAGDAGAGRIIRFKNENGVDVEITLDRSDLFKSDGGGVLDRLADAGMDLRFSGKNGRSDMLDLLRSIKSDRQIPTAPRPGWTRDRAGRVTGFLCPTGELIPATDDTPDMRLHSTGMVKDRAPAGTLDAWKDAAKAAHHNFHWTFGLCAGFAGPLLGLIEGQPCGVNLSGDSSLGKTIALLLGTTIWTSPANGRGVFHVMNSTANAVEDLATIGTETFLGLDEIGAMQNPAALGSTLFGLSSATGKNRKAGRGVGLAQTAEFRPFVITTHERSLKTTIKDAGGDYKTGLSVRFPDVDVTAAKRVSVDVLDQLDMVKDNFGHAGPAFVRHLIAQGWHTRPDDLKKRISETADTIAGKGAAPALRRAAHVFALVQVAGELAADAGLIDRDPIKDAVQTAFDTFKDSDEGRATNGGDAALDEMRSWIALSLGHTLINASEAADSRYRSVRGWFTDKMIVLDYEKMADTKAMGLSAKRDAVLAALDERGALIKSGKNRVHNKLPAEVKLDGGPSEREVRCVRLDRDKLGV